MNHEQTMRSPTYLDRETGILAVTFWPLHRPRRSEDTPWGVVDLLKRGRPTGIEIWTPVEFLHSDPVRWPARCRQEEPAGGGFEAEPYSYCDRGKERNVFRRTEMGKKERTTKGEPTR